MKKDYNENEKEIKSHKYTKRKPSPSKEKKVQKGKKDKREKIQQNNRTGLPENILMKRLMSLGLLLCFVGFLLLAFAIRLKHPGNSQNIMETQTDWQDLNTFARQYHKQRHIDEPMMF